MLDSNRLRHFMAQFYGYGTLSSSFWFVGMEEGGGNTEREISERLRQWETLGRQPVVDIAQFHEGVHDVQGRSMNYFFERRPKLQRTWAGLIRILLASRGEDDESAEAVRSVQASRWGRSNSDGCLLELLPLPSPGTGQWYYNTWTDIPELRSRQRYYESLTHSRTERLKGLVRDYTPRCVVFYSVSPKYIDAWSGVVGTDLTTVTPEQMCRGNQGQGFAARFYQSDSTLYVVTYHPAYKGLTKEYFTQVGKTIRQRSRAECNVA